MPLSTEQLPHGERENTPWLHRYSDILTPPMRVLDLGCGTGDDSLELAEKGCRVIALDYHRYRLAHVPTHPNIDLRVCADLAGYLPFQSASFDAVIASLSLHYFDTGGTRAAFANVASVLRPDGYLICRVNAVGDWNFGYGQGEEIEPSVFSQPEGRLKRFFSIEALEGFLQPCFTVERLAARTILQNRREKRTLECLARKR